MLKSFIERQNAYRLMQAYLTAKGRKQTSAAAWLPEIVRNRQIVKVLDLGCGEEGSVDLFNRLTPNAAWHGVDIETSPEVDRRARDDVQFDTFDGTELPYEDQFFDLVYSNQVLEHVRYPDKLMPDVMRVLKPGGVLIGEVSYLEPYHSYSIFNFTPYGLSCVLRDAGFELIEVRPGIDSYSLIARQLVGAPSILNFLFKASPFNLFIGTVGTMAMLPQPMIAFLKLQYCGQFSFLAKRTS